MDSANFPVDIQCMKIPEWLAQRGHIQAGWRESLDQLEKSTITPLIENLSSNEKQLIPTLDRHLKLAETDLTFPFHVCQDIFNYYSLKEGVAKDIFGKYSKIQVRAWSEVIKQYQKDNIHIMGSGYNLGRLMKYELVYWRKQKDKVHQQLQLITQRKAGLVRQLDMANDKFAKLCALYHITPDIDLDKEEVWEFVIQRITREGIHSMKEVVQSENFVKLKEIAKFYLKFTRAWHFGDSSEEENIVREKSILPILTNILEENSKSEESHISENFIMIKKHDEIRVEQDYFTDNSSIQVIDIDSYSAEQSQPQHLKVYSDPSLRMSILNELDELEFFLKQRQKEMEISETTSDTFAFSLSDMIESTSLTQALKDIGLPEVEEMLTVIKNARKNISTTQIQQAYLLLSSNHYSLRLKDDLNGQKRHLLKISNKISGEDQTSSSCTDNLRIIVARIQEVAAECKALKKMIESEFSSVLKGRIVNLVGEVNRL